MDQCHFLIGVDLHQRSTKVFAILSELMLWRYDTILHINGNSPLYFVPLKRPPGASKPSQKLSNVDASGMRRSRSDQSFYYSIVPGYIQLRAPGRRAATSPTLGPAPLGLYQVASLLQNLRVRF